MSAGVPAEDEAAAGLEELRRARFAERLRDKDPGLWPGAAAQPKALRRGLGWVSLPDAMAAGLGPVRSFAAEARRDGLTHAVVLGTGSAGLLAEAWRVCGARAPGQPTLEVLDSSNPAAIAALETRIPLDRALFLVASKTGSALEPNCLLEYFFEKVCRRAGSKAGGQFAAVTDPGTSLERLARSRGFRKVFLGPPDVAASFSALSLFGLVPAALMGADLQGLLGGARACARDCGEGPAAAQSPALRLGAALAAHARRGRDKLTLSLSAALEPLGPWIEQLVAQSTGQQGRGLVPVCAEPLAAPDSYGPDRLFVRIGLRPQPDPGAEARLAALERAGQPVLRLELADAGELGAQFYLWQVAAAAAAFLLGADPFDERGAADGQARTWGLLRALERGDLPAEPADLRAGGLAAFADQELLSALGAGRGLDLPLRRVLGAHLSRLGPGDYGAILAYVDPDESARRQLDALRENLRRASGAAVSVQFGPRYLHGPAPLYKGGPARGLFLELVQPDAAALRVPGQEFSFGALHRAQARGDYAALREGGRRILRLDLGAAAAQSLRALVNATAEPAADRPPLSR